MRIALANLRFPATPDESIALARQGIERASREAARIICFPECFVPGYRGAGKGVPPPDPGFLERAWSETAEAAAKAGMTVVLGTERVLDGALVATAMVVGEDGSIAGFQDVRPDGTLLVHQPYGEEGLLVADIDLAEATGLLAKRCRTES